MIEITPALRAWLRIFEDQDDELEQRISELPNKINTRYLVLVYDEGSFVSIEQMNFGEIRDSDSLEYIHRRGCNVYIYDLHEHHPCRVALVPTRYED